MINLQQNIKYFAGTLQRKMLAVLTIQIYVYILEQQILLDIISF